MPAITKPASPGWQHVSARYRKVKARQQSPFTLEATVYTWTGSLWMFTFKLPPIKDATVAKSWMAFLKDLEDGDNYFSCDISRYVPTAVSSPMNLRLSPGGIDWETDRVRLYGFTFTAEEYK